MSDKAWRGEYFGENGFVAEVERKFKRGEANKSELSSAYYSAATHARARGDSATYEANLEKAVKLSDEFAGEMEKRMSADDLDIRQSILRAAGRLDDALAAITSGLAKAKKPHTKALLLLGKVEILLERENAAAAQEIVTEIEKLAPQVATEDKLQATRVYRGLAHFYKKGARDEEKATAAAKESERLIEETGAEDQRLKLKAELGQK